MRTLPFLLLLILIGFGIGYSQDNDFGTKAGTFMDSRDSHVYRWVKIGEQTWMAKNLAFNADSGAVCPDNNLVNCDYYGVLYSWDVAQIVCPEGWSLPSDEQWGELEQELGIDKQEIFLAGPRGSIQAIGIKSRFGWSSNGNGSDKYGLDILPAGFYNKVFSHMGSAAYFWSSTRQKRNKLVPAPWTRSLHANHNMISRYMMNQSSYLSVRCIKN